MNSYGLVNPDFGFKKKRKTSVFGLKLTIKISLYL